MDVEFADSEYDRLETDADFDGGHSTAIVKAYRKRLQVLRVALDERDIRAYKSWRFEKLKGDREHQHSIRLNDQFRLIVELKELAEGKCVHIIEIEDYH